MDIEDDKDMDENLNEMELSYDGHPQEIPASVSPKITRFRQNKRYSKLMQAYIVTPQAKYI